MFSKYQLKVPSKLEQIWSSSSNIQTVHKNSVEYFNSLSASHSQTSLMSNSELGSEYEDEATFFASIIKQKIRSMKTLVKQVINITQHCDIIVQNLRIVHQNNLNILNYIKK
ncbi:Hypothetical_protein [Hexamita inflata]|uniref:Hypothetical_protein n=1 Tax=Hexamita inflata TaxID=28002 RepID=A0AA86PYZ8_9EUKA|nr:Hypothetical protein HINF_LOCUS34103 [Hexamita inflata]